MNTQVSYNVYYKDKTGEEILLRSELNEDMLKKVLAAFELSGDTPKEQLRIEEIQDRQIA